MVRPPPLRLRGRWQEVREAAKYFHRHKDTVVKGAKRGKNPPEEWVITKDAHEAIVDREVWEQAQRLMGKGKSRSKKAPEENPYLLSCLLRCGKCGSVMYAMPKRGIVHYECGAATWERRTHNLPTCVGTTVREDAV